MPDRVRNLRHHGDREVTAGLLDLAVNVYAGARPTWLDDALHAGLDASGSYPDPATAEAAVAASHGRSPGEVLATAGAAEAFGLVARWRRWRRPVVVHPQFTEPHAALLQAGHRVTEVLLSHPFLLDPGLVPDDADLVVVGNPTNPTGVLHPAEALRGLLRPGRVVVVDEAFMDAVPGETESLAGDRLPGLVVLRSLTKHWGIPGVRAGYLLGVPPAVAELRRGQPLWSVSATAVAALRACTTPAAAAEAERRAYEIAGWRTHLEKALGGLGVEHLPSAAPFVLAHVGTGVHAALRARGVAVRRADTFPGLDASWVRVAVRPDDVTDRLVSTLSAVLSDVESMR
jgi:histidinol-phosphate/aromatic aminotransferase/cobyric acid decarboxylase-like protein